MTATTALSELGLKQMVIAALAREGITTEDQLREVGRSTLSRIPGIGRFNLAHIYHVLDGENSVAIHQIENTISRLEIKQKRYQVRVSEVKRELRALDKKRKNLLDEH